jgi:hypothetical protein
VPGSFGRQFSCHDRLRGTHIHNYSPG